MTVYVGPLNELPGIDHALEIPLGDEVVVLTRYLSVPRLPGGMRNAIPDPDPAFPYGTYDSCFSRTRRCSDYKNLSSLLHFLFIAAASLQDQSYVTSSPRKVPSGANLWAIVSD
jgi:hypothetical protein